MENTGKWNGQSLWCRKCGRGIKGIKDEKCPVCVSKFEGNPGILMTPPEAEAERKKEAEALLLLKMKNVRKGYKGIDDVKAELKSELIAEITKNFNITPKVQPTVMPKIPPKVVPIKPKVEKPATEPAVAKGSAGSGTSKS